MHLPFGSPHQLARQVRAQEKPKAGVDFELTDAKASRSVLDGPREFHRLAHINALSPQRPVRSIRIARSQGECGQAFAALEKPAVVVEPGMRARRSEKLDVGTSKHDAVILRADAVIAARRERKAQC